MRKIELYLPFEFWQRMSAHREAVKSAIGHLALWSLGDESLNHHPVKIVHERDGNMQASYFRRDGSLSFFMHAQWNEHDGTYTFHS